MGDAGFIAGVVFGSAAAFGFVAACLYSAYKAVRDHKRIAEKQAQKREQQLLAISEQTAAFPAPPEIEEPPSRTSRSLSTPGLLLEQRRPSAFAPPPQAMERRWTRAGLEYRHEGGVVHIHKTDDADGDDSVSHDSAEDCNTDSNIPYKRHIDSGEPPASSPRARGKSTPGTKAKKLPTVPPPQVQIQVSLTTQSDSNGDTTTFEEVTVTPKPVSVRTSGDGSRTQTITEISSNETIGNAGKVKDAADWV